MPTGTSISLIFKILFVCVHTHARARECHSELAGVRGQLVGVLIVHSTEDENSGCQAWQKGP